MEGFRALFSSALACWEVSVVSGDGEIMDFLNLQVLTLGIWGTQPFLLSTLYSFCLTLFHWIFQSRDASQVLLNIQTTPTMRHMTWHDELMKFFAAFSNIRRLLKIIMLEAEWNVGADRMKHSPSQLSREKENAKKSCLLSFILAKRPFFCSPSLSSPFTCSWMRRRTWKYCTANKSFRLMLAGVRHSKGSYMKRHYSRRYGSLRCLLIQFSASQWLSALCEILALLPERNEFTVKNDFAVELAWRDGSLPSHCTEAKCLRNSIS